MQPTKVYGILSNLHGHSMNIVRNFAEPFDCCLKAAVDLEVVQAVTRYQRQKRYIALYVNAALQCHDFALMIPCQLMRKNLAARCTAASLRAGVKTSVIETCSACSAWLA